MATSSFRGGAALEAKLKEIADRAGKAGTLKVGFLEGATYPDGTSVPFVAAMNEYGHTVQTKDGPFFQMPRPFFRNMIAAKSPQWGESLGNLARANDYDIDKTLGQMGEGIRSQLQESIRTFNGAPLADSTIERKGFPTPLVETNHMKDSVDFEVSKE